MKFLLPLILMAIIALPGAAQELKIENMNYNTNDSVPLDVFHVLNNKINKKVIEKIKLYGSTDSKHFYSLSGKIADTDKELGIRKELLNKLWYAAPGIPDDCRRILFGTPVLVNPNTGVIFGYIHKKSVVCFRIPENYSKLRAKTHSIANSSNASDYIDDANWFTDTCVAGCKDLIHRAFEYSFKPNN